MTAWHSQEDMVDPLALEHVVGRLDGLGTIAWAFEEELDLGTDGREYLVARLRINEWTLSIGCGEASFELDIAIDGLVADGHAVVLDDWIGGHTAMEPCTERVVWCGPKTSSSWRDVAPDAGVRLVPAVSAEEIGRLLVRDLRAMRPGLAVVHDPDWRHHVHPLAHLIARHADDPTVVLDGDETISFTHEAFAAFLALDLDTDLAMLTASPEELDDMHRRAEAARWTDGTYLVDED